VRRFLTVLVAVFLLPATAHAATVPVMADTYVRSDLPTTNFEATSPDPLHVDGSPVRRSLLYFPNTPANVVSATLRVHVRFHTGEPFEVRASSCMWSETGLTFNTAPAPGPVLGTAPDDPVGYVEIPIPASALNNQYGGSEQSPTSNCFQLTKTGDNWMTLSSRESANPAQLVVETQPPPPPTDTDGDGVPDSSDLCPGTPAGTTVDSTGCPVVTPPPSAVVDDCSGGAVVSAAPSTLASAVASSTRVIVNAAPGNYGGLTRYPGTTQACVKIKCTVAAKTGNGENSGGCRALGQWTFGNVRNLTVEGFHFVTGDDYGLSFYNESPIITGMGIRVADNVFHGNMYHDISTKSSVQYTEVINNLFISCMRHCWEIGQNGNIRSRPDTAWHSVFRGNTASSRINVVTNRSTQQTDVENNTFGSASGYVVVSQTYWAFYPFGAGWDDGRLMVPGTLGTFNSSGSWTGYTAPVPLRTNITGNSFSSGNRMLFEGRGVIDDVVKAQGNSGTPGCSRVNMPSDTAAAHANEQTLNPPMRDPTSDMAC
jgi:hypothetical protein